MAEMIQNKRLIFVPQYPAPNRYQEWWINEFPKHLAKYFREIVVLGNHISPQTCSYGNAFSPINKAIEYETYQINQYMDMDIDIENDILFLADISFPGIFANILTHKKPKYCYAFCHGTSLNAYDYFQPVRSYKWRLEKSHHINFNVIFVATFYHFFKLRKNASHAYYSIIGLPKPPENIIKQYEDIRDIDIIIPARPTKQKVTKLHVEYINKKYAVTYLQADNWEEYSKKLSRSKILLITSKEDTFNYTILDAIKCGCIPIAPNKLCFPEILPEQYLYNDKYHLREIIKLALENKISPPTETLVDKMINNFYKKLAFDIEISLRANL